MTETLTPDATGEATEDQFVTIAEIKAPVRVGKPTAQPSAQPRSLAGASSFAYRADHGSFRGEYVIRINDQRLTKDSLLFVSIGEGSVNTWKFLGNATFTVLNIVADNGYALARVRVDWPTNLRVYADWLVINP